MCQTAVIEYLELWNIMNAVILSDQPDKLVWQWSPDGKYSAKSAYAMLHSGAATFRGHKLIWKTWAPLRIKIFLWLSFKRKHWTADRRACHGLDAADRCFLCDQALETIDHLLATCPFTREVWHFLLQAIGLRLPPMARTTIIWWQKLRRLTNSAQRKGVDSLFALVSWQVWKERNARFFRDAMTKIVELLQVVKAEANLWIEAGATGLSGTLIAG